MKGLCVGGNSKAFTSPLGARMAGLLATETVPTVNSVGGSNGVSVVVRYK